MRLTLAALALAALAACTPKPPPVIEPTPPPPPPPPVEQPGPKYLDMLLRTCGAAQLCVDGKPVDFAGAEACCMAWERGRSGWPLFSVEFADWTKQQGAVTFLHARPGPFLVADEPEWKDFGGAYIEVDGKADLTRWNEPFWRELERIVDHAGRNGQHVEIDLIDSWRLKGGCDKSPWNPYLNIQGEDHCKSSHRGPGDAVHDAYLRKLVSTVGRYGNVIWQIGNESGLVAGKNEGLRQWERWVRDRVRVHETEVAFGVVHMVGTNSEFDEIEASDIPDYVNLHGMIPSKPSYGKPTLNNETNPAPANMVQTYCNARAGGAYFWAWRSELPQNEWEAALAGIAAARLNGCQVAPPVGTCTAPVPERVGDWTGPQWHGGWYDVTPVIKDCAFCAASGQGTMDDGSIRCGCPARGEPPSPKAEERSACEAVAVGGVPLWRCAEGQPTVNPGNPYQARCDAGGEWIEVCHADGQTCKRVAQ